MSQFLSPRQHAARVERISQSAVGLRVRDSQADFKVVQDRLLSWLAAEAGGALPDAMLAGGTATLDAPGAPRTETVALDGVLYWAARQELSDPKLPHRMWVTEVSLAANGSALLRLGYRLHCLTRGERAPLPRAVPRFMRELAARYEMLLDEQFVDICANAAESETDGDDLARLLCDPQRRLPVVGVSRSPEDNQFLIDPDALAEEVIGNGFVFSLSREAGFRLTDILGKQLSVYNGAVRIWYPGVRATDSDPYDHSLFLAERIMEDLGRLRQTICERVFHAAVSRRDADDVIPPFSAARQAAAQMARADAAAQGRSSADMIRLLESDNKRLLAELAEMRGEQQDLLALADGELAKLRGERDEALAEIERLRARMIAYETAQQPKIVAFPDLPDTFDALKEWSERHLQDVVVVLPRCIRAAKKSVFGQPELAYQALLLLRDAYVPMRRDGGEQLRALWSVGLKQLGLELSPSHGGTRAGENPDDYFVQYDGRRWELDQHLKGSNSRDPRFGFRLYFFWHPGERRAIVGSLPSHLSTRIT